MYLLNNYGLHVLEEELPACVVNRGTLIFVCKIPKTTDSGGPDDASHVFLNLTNKLRQAEKHSGLQFHKS